MPRRGLLLGASGAALLARCFFPALGDWTGDADATVEAGPIAYVQSFTQSYTPPAAVAMPAAIAAGDTIVLCSEFPVDLGSLEVTDTLGRTFVPIGSQDGIGTESASRQVVFASIGGPGGNDVITLATTNDTLSDGGAAKLEAYVFEYRGVSALDHTLATAGAIGAVSFDAAVPWDAGSIAATAGELLFGYVEGESEARLDDTFLSRTTFDGNNVGDRSITAPGEYAVTGIANDNWTLIAATFR